MTWVVDASVAVRWFLKEEAHENADEVLRRIVEKPDEFAVPELFLENHAPLFENFGKAHGSGGVAGGHGAIDCITQSGEPLRGNI